MALVFRLLVCLGVRIKLVSFARKGVSFIVWRSIFGQLKTDLWIFERGLGWFWGPVGYWLWRLHIIGRHGEAEATQGQGAPSLHSQRQRIPATTTAVPTRLLTRCPQNMIRLPKYAQNSKMYQNIKYAQPHNIIPPKSGVRFSSQHPALPDNLLKHCDPKQYQDPPLPTQCQRNSPKPKSAKNRVPNSRASQSL